MKKTAVLLYPQFSEYELSVALSILMQGAKPIVTVGLSDTLIRGESGLTCLADTTIHQLKDEEIDSLLLPGCMDIGVLQHEQHVLTWIQRIAEQQALIASISSSPYLLAKAGLLKDKKYTVGLTQEQREVLGVFEGSHYMNDLVVQDGNIITARGSGFIQFGIVMGQALRLSFNDKWYQA
ncbi:DJ-1/PfpI family protein [Lysinibacillus piscis]|uniref:DJ-1/PfpI domain-containing protein n=1 Tax=Lysinibacillus piscis TaxID=2518931 RepID=A0ABQ5NGA5_9BACI|nr:DJ-1/PfpI family protein [Lysinibacillus sp. KH24]GLC87079.1 hypothetical protein LYSBPC_02060 [Lysinibacillus sp. KH24]